MTSDELLARYPKARPALSERHRKIYVKEYVSNRTGANLASAVATRLERWMHYRVASRQVDGEVLELGAGTLNHLTYERRHSAYDVVEPFVALYENNPLRSRVRRFYSSTADIAETERYDRIISIAVLEHMSELPTEIAHAGKRLSKDGVFQAGFPTEGGALWGGAWRFGTGMAYRLRTGLDYGELMRHEHVNDEKEIIGVIGYFFGKTKIARFPLPFRHFSLYTYVEATSPLVDRCERYLSVRGGAGREIPAGDGR